MRGRTGLAASAGTDDKPFEKGRVGGGKQGGSEASRRVAEAAYGLSHADAGTPVGDQALSLPPAS